MSCRSSHHLSQTPIAGVAGGGVEQVLTVLHVQHWVSLIAPLVRLWELHEDVPPIVELGTMEIRQNLPHYLGHWRVKIGRARSTMKRTCSVKSMVVVSRCTASSAGRRGATSRVESAWSRAARAAVSASRRPGSTAAPRWLIRRPARAWGEAVRKILRSASGNTTV